MKWFKVITILVMLGAALPAAAQSPTGTPDYRQMVPVGTLMIWGGNYTPDGWLVADGRCVSQATYPKLYQAIGLVFDYTHSCVVGQFALPDLRDKAPRGVGSRTAIGYTYIQDFVTLSVENLPPHNHTILPDGSTVRIFLATPQAVNNSAFPTGSVRALNNASVTGYTGSGVPFSIVPSSQLFNFIINAGTSTLVLPPTATAVPTATPAFTATPQPTSTPAPTATPQPTWTLGPGSMITTPMPEIVLYTTMEANGNYQAVAFEYSMTAGDVMVSVLLLFTCGLLALGMVMRARGDKA